MAKRNTRTATIKVDADVKRAETDLRKISKTVDEAAKHTALWARESELAMVKFDKAGQASAGATKGIVDSLKAANGSIENFLTQLGSITGVAGLAVAAIGKLAAASGELAKESLRTQAVFGNLKFSLDGARRASLGLVDDMTLAQLQLTATELGAAQTSQHFEELAEAGAILGLTMKGDAADGMRDLIEGIAKGSPEILNNLGIIIDSQAAYEAYAAEVGKAAKELSEAEKLTARQAAGRRQALEMARAMAVEESLALDRVRMGVKWDNFKTDAIGGQVSEQAKLQTILEKLGPDIQHINILNRKQGADLERVRKIALLAGTSIEELGGAQALQAKFAAEANRQLEAQARAAEDAAKAQELLNQQLAFQAAQAEVNEDIAAIEFEMQLARAEGTMTAAELADMEISLANERLNAADAALEHAEQTGAEADALAQLAKAADQAAGAVQLAEAKRRGMGRRRGGRGGRKKDPLADLFKKRGDDGATEKLIAEWDAEDRARADRQLQLMEDVGALRQAQLEREKAAEQEAFDLQMGRLQREIEWREANGLDHETQLQRLAQMTEARLQAEGDLNGAEQAAHEERVRRLQIEQAERAKVMKQVTAATAQTVQAFAVSTEAAVKAKDGKERAFAGELAEFTASRGKMLTIEAATHFALAAVWAAALNPVKATAELTAGGIAAAKGGALLSAAAALGGIAGGGADTGGLPSGGGGGFVPNTTRPAAPEAGSAPISPLEQNGTPAPQSSTGGGAAPITVNVSGSYVDSGGQLLEMIEEAKATGRGLRGGF